MSICNERQTVILLDGRLDNIKKREKEKMGWKKNEREIEKGREHSEEQAENVVDFFFLSSSLTLRTMIDGRMI